MSKWRRMSKREEKPLLNKCDTVFVCRDRKYRDECVYYKEDGARCKFDEFDGMDSLWVCASAVARTNAMVLELQRMGFTVELKKKEGKA